MNDSDRGAGHAAPRKRADARRNERTLLDAAAAVFVTSGVEAPVRDIHTLHAYFLDRLVPVCARLLEAAAVAGEIRSDIDAYELMRGVGNLCIGADDNPATTHAEWLNSSSQDCAYRISRNRVRCVHLTYAELCFGYQNPPTRQRLPLDEHGRKARPRPRCLTRRVRGRG